MTGRTAARGRSAGHEESGTATLFVVMLSLVLFALAGLVIDGGLAINARQRVADDVEQAARAGAERIDVPTLRATGVVRIDEPAARDAAAAFLTGRGYGAGDLLVSTTATTVTARGHQKVPTALLSIVRITSFDVDAEATARAAVGITAEVP